MQILQIRYSSVFQKQYKKLPVHIKNLAEKKVEIFRADPFDPSLKTHKLTGKLEGFYAFSINYQYRIIFAIRDEKLGIIGFVATGTHKIYKK